jgi:Flp pilus assembly pilin Flp
MVSLKSLSRNQEGATLIEYGLMAGLLGCAILVGSHALREPVTEMYDQFTSKTNSVFAVQPAAGPKRMKVIDGGNALES